MKRTGNSKKTGKQYTYYCCERLTSKDEANKCDFMTWDVPVADNCPACGDTMFKKAGKGFKKPFCINEKCENFTPEEKRGGWKKKPAGEEAGEAPGAADAAPAPVKKAPAKKTAAKKTPAKKPAAAKAAATKTAAAKKTTVKKAAAKKSTAKTAAKKAPAGKAEE